MSFGNPSWVSPAILTAVALVEAVVAVTLFEMQSLTFRTSLVMIGIFLAAFFLLWLKWPTTRRILGLYFATTLCGFAMTGNLLTHRIAEALGFGSIFLFGVFLIIRGSSRVKS